MQKAKFEMLKALKKMAQEEMGDKLVPELKGMQKVTVAAKDKSGLEEGLEKAKEIVGGESEDSEESEEMEMGEVEEEEQPQSLAEVEEKIKELMELKKKLLAEKME